jgi:hypothetical protein
VAELLEGGDEVLLEQEAGVVGPDGDAHVSCYPAISLARRAVRSSSSDAVWS